MTSEPSAAMEGAVEVDSRSFAPESDTRRKKGHQSVASGTVLVTWGIALSLFPPYADLSDGWSTGLRVVSGALYILGFFVILGSAGQISSKLAIQACIFCLGSVGVVLTLHLMSSLVEARWLELVFKAAALAVLCLLLMGAIMTIPKLVAEPDTRGEFRIAGSLRSGTDSETLKDHGSKRERGTELAIAAITLLVALIELGRVVIDS